MLPLPVPPSLQVPPVPPAATADAVADAERAFAADAARRGTPAAFVAHFAADGLVFTPVPGNARALYGAKHDDGSLLSWEPSHVEASASGDFAVSTGPWSWRAKGATAPSAFGHFLSLWVRRGGRWQVHLDIGVPHPPQEPEPLSQVSRLPAGLPSIAPGAGWRSFDAAARRDLLTALREAGAPDLRLYRRGQAVRPGNLAALGASETGAARYESLGREVAASGDLACRWGWRTRDGARALVLQVWRREAPGWRLAMDAALPAPPGP